jgi:hypothetical protein
MKQKHIIRISRFTNGIPMNLAHLRNSSFFFGGGTENSAPESPPPNFLSRHISQQSKIETIENLHELAAAHRLVPESRFKCRFCSQVEKHNLGPIHINFLHLLRSNIQNHKIWGRADSGGDFLLPFKLFLI